MSNDGFVSQDPTQPICSIEVDDAAAANEADAAPAIWWSGTRVWGLAQRCDGPSNGTPSTFIIGFEP